MSRSRRTPFSSVLERADLESDVEVFQWTGENRNIQMSTHKMLAVGGGETDKAIERRLRGDDSVSEEGNKKNGQWNFGLALNSDLSSGSSGNCVTFGISGLSLNGDTFEVLNVEIWTLTPMTDIDKAEKLELACAMKSESIHRQAMRRNSISGPMSGLSQNRDISEVFNPDTRTMKSMTGIDQAGLLKFGHAMATSSESTHRRMARRNSVC